MSKQEEEVVSDLPDDLVAKILYRFPVKTLLRFTCVSKRWRSIILESKFARSAFEFASQTRTLRPRLLISSYPYEQLGNHSVEWGRSVFESFRDLDVCRLTGNRLVQSLTPPWEIVIERVIGSCNGLVVLGKRVPKSYTNLCVWNPTTGFSRKIPDPEFSLQGGHIYDVTSAFGHVMATDDYKLVFFVPVDSTVHIFSTRAGSWKVIGCPHSSFPSFGDREGLLVSNGAIHWVSTGIPEAISAFDLVSEEFCQLPLPPASVLNEVNEGGVNGKRILWTQVLVGGRLCVRSHNEYWVMKQYRVPESWVKMFQFSVAELQNAVPAFVTEGGTVVMMLHGKELVRFECHREGEPVCSGRYKIEGVSVSNVSCKSEITVYDETLISIL